MGEPVVTMTGDTGRLLDGEAVDEWFPLVGGMG